MRRDGASCFVFFYGDEWEVRAERFENDLPCLASPHLDEILAHVFVGEFTRADGNRLPCDGYASIFIAFRACPTGTGIIRRDNEFDAGVHDGQRLWITLDLEKFFVHPAIGASVLRVYVFDPDPIISIGATDQFYFCGSVEGEEIKIFRAGTVAAG